MNQNAYIISANIILEVSLKPLEKQKLKNKSSDKISQELDRNVNYKFIEYKEKSNRSREKLNKFYVKYKITDSIVGLSESKALSDFKNKYSEKSCYKLIEDSIKVEDIEPNVDII